MVDRISFCPICGGPIRPPLPENGGAWGDDIKWQTEAVLLSDPEDEYQQLELHYKGGKMRGAQPANIQIQTDIRQERVTITRSSTCVLEETGEEVAPNLLARFDDPNILSAMTYSIVVHRICIDIALKVMRRSQNDVRVRSLRTLWKVLRTRFDARDSEYMGTVDKPGPQYIVMEHGYYMPRGFADDYLLWEYAAAHWVVANPTNIPGLTAHIIANTKACESQSANPSTEAFARLFLSLPQELQDRVVSFMGYYKGLPTHCTGLLPQNTWLHILLDGRLLPFLWDVDIKAMQQFYDTKAREGVELNWELLVRQLSHGVWSTWEHHDSTQAGSHEYFCYPELKVPDGLRNRRRIWQLLEEMYVGDVLPVGRNWSNSKQAPTMARYWDAYGDPVYPVVRVSGILT